MLADANVVTMVASLTHNVEVRQERLGVHASMDAFFVALTLHHNQWKKSKRLRWSKAGIKASRLPCDHALIV